MSKKKRKSVDLSPKSFWALQIQGTLSGYATVKPYLEKLLEEQAEKVLKNNPDIAKVIKNKN